MKTLPLFLLIASLLTCYACSHKTPPELNNIVLKDPPEDVYDSMMKLNNLLSRLPNEKNMLRNFGFADKGKGQNNDFNKDTVLFINDHEINTVSIDTVSVLSVYTAEERRTMVSLMQYLKSNYLHFGSYEMGFGPFWYYGYREDLSDFYVPDMRSLVALKEVSDTDHFETVSVFRIIDRKRKLILVGE